MGTLLFIPSLFEGDIHGFMTEIAIVMLLWLVVIAASMIDLITGISASRRVGRKRTTSWGLRRTLSKDLQYLSMLVMLLIIDVVLSVLSPYLTIFSIPLLSALGSGAIVIVEAISVYENMRKGKDEKEDKLDDVFQVVASTADAVGNDKVLQMLEALKKHVEQKKD